MDAGLRHSGVSVFVTFFTNFVAFDIGATTVIGDDAECFVGWVVGRAAEGWMVKWVRW